MCSDHLTIDPSDPAVWQAINPGLSIDDAGSILSNLEISPQLMEQQVAQFHDQGYLNFPPLFRASEIQPLKQGILTLADAGLPAAYIYIYDQPWQLFARLRPLISHFLGENFRLLPNFWAWNIPSEKGHRGWPAHQDCQAQTRFDDGLGGDLLMSLSLWVPLSDATLDNGCMHVLPRSKELAYQPALLSQDQIRPADGLALPAKAGSVLGWPQDLYHWSGETTGLSEEPRISLSLEFQNPAFEALRDPLLDLDNPPSLAERLDLIHQQFPRYRHMEDTGYHPQELATRLHAFMG